jgi:nitroreductase
VIKIKFLDLVINRYSVRKYEARKVEEEKILQILEAGRVAPSAKNRRPIKLIVIKEEKGLHKLKKGANVYEAPLVIIACGDVNAAALRPADGRNLVDVDTSIVTDHMMLQASDLGLGTCWICDFDPVIIKNEFNIPDHLEPINILAIGYASGEPVSLDQHDKIRKSLKEIVAYETL